MYIRVRFVVVFNSYYTVEYSAHYSIKSFGYFRITRMRQSVTANITMHT